MRADLSNARALPDGTEQRKAAIEDSLMFLITSVARRFSMDDFELAAHLAALVDWYDGEYANDRFELVEATEPKGRRRKRGI